MNNINVMWPIMCFFLVFFKSKLLHKSWTCKIECCVAGSSEFVCLSPRAKGWLSAPSTFSVSSLQFLWVCGQWSLACICLIDALFMHQVQLASVIINRRGSEWTAKVAFLCTFIFVNLNSDNEITFYDDL